jgi:RNA methyltransferase, TrmH family
MTKAEMQRLRSLREKKNRETLGLFVVEGEKVVSELLAAGFEFEEIFATSEWLRENRKAADHGTATEISSDEMARASHFPTPSSVLGVGKIVRAPLAAGALDHGFTLALDGVQDPGNVGTLVRIADWFGFDRVVLSPDSADVFHQKVINASMGSFARVPVHTAELSDALALVAPGTPVLGCDLQGTDVHALTALRAAIVVIGSEGHGLSAAVRQRVTHYVTVPKYGRAESLNAAVAAAIVCDNVRRVAR